MEGGGQVGIFRTMKQFRLIILTISLLSGLSGAFAQSGYNTCKPWTYWWWMGSAVNQKDIKIQLDEFSRTGIGGVHIIPIYGVKGYEKQFIPFLSEQWMEMIRYTIQEARKLNLGVDITLGTGWPYGGPWVDTLNSAKRLVLKEDASHQTSLTAMSTGQKVKRAAPGGEGLVIDYFNENTVKNYLHHFDSIFSSTKFPVKPRAWYGTAFCSKRDITLSTIVLSKILYT